MKKYFFVFFPLGAYDSIRSSYNKSRDAERRANESTTTRPSTVSQSADTRRRTERLIAAKKDDFNRKNAANKRALGDLNAKAQGLNMKKINEKVWSHYLKQLLQFDSIRVYSHTKAKRSNYWSSEIEKNCLKFVKHAGITNETAAIPFYVFKGKHSINKKCPLLTCPLVCLR